MVKILRGPTFFPVTIRSKHRQLSRLRMRSGLFLGADSIPAATAATNFPRPATAAPPWLPLLIIVSFARLLPIFPWLWLMSDRMGTFYDGLVTVSSIYPLLHISPHSPAAWESQSLDWGESCNTEIQAQTLDSGYRPDAGAARSYNNKTQVKTA